MFDGQRAYSTIEVAWKGASPLGRGVWGEGAGPGGGRLKDFLVIGFDPSLFSLIS